MSIDMDKILGNKSSVPPYANDQPGQLNMQHQTLQRFPALATAEGINPDFQQFFDSIVNAITQQRYFELFQLSDNAISEQSFSALIENNWDNHWMEFYMSNPVARGLDIELNMDRFKELHRNIIGGFNIMTYHLNVKHDEFQPEGTNTQVTEFVKASTELLFTYKYAKGFELISRIQPFTKETI